MGGEAKDTGALGQVIGKVTGAGTDDDAAPGVRLIVAPGRIVAGGKQGLGCRARSNVEGNIEALARHLEAPAMGCRGTEDGRRRRRAEQRPVAVAQAAQRRFGVGRRGARHTESRKHGAKGVRAHIVMGPVHLPPVALDAGGGGDLTQRGIGNARLTDDVLGMEHHRAGGQALALG